MKAMKRIMIVGLIMMGFIACNDDGTTNSGNTTPDSAYNNPTATDTGQGMQPSGTGTGSGTGSGKLDSTNVKPGAGAGTGSGIQASQDTGSGARRQ
jgi:hypothetical protein